MFGKRKVTRNAPAVDKKLCGQMVFDKNGNGHRCGKKKGHLGKC